MTTMITMAAGIASERTSGDGDRRRTTNASKPNTITVLIMCPLGKLFPPRLPWRSSLRLGPSACSIERGGPG